MSSSPPAGAWPRRLHAERVRGVGPPLVEVARTIATALPPLLGTGSFCWDVEAEPAQRVELDDATLARMIARLRRARPFLLADRANAWKAMIVIGVDERAGREYVDLPLPDAREPQLADLDGMLAAVHAVATGLAAHVAYAEDAALAHSFSGRRAHQRSRAALPPQVRAIVPDDPFEPVPGLAAPLPELMHPVELPADRLPAAVYWINWWSAPMIDELGRDRVRAAPWARVVEHADGSMSLAATPEPPDLTSRGDMEHLARLIAALDLQAAQRRVAGTP